MKKSTFLITVSLALAGITHAELKLPTIIGDRMVLQQKQANPIWGWDTPGTEVTVTFANQSVSAKAGADGKWAVKLAPLPANATPQTLKVVGSTTREVAEVLVGEVWMCSGQSNMQWRLNQAWNGDLEAAASDFPGIRLIQVPQLGTQELQSDFKGQWQACAPESAAKFSAVGLFFGRYLHEILKVPVGLIDNSWGGSAAEAWVRRESLESDPRFARLMAATAKKEAELMSEKGRAEFQKAMEDWKIAQQAARAVGKTGPRKPQEWLSGNQRPGNIFAGAVHPTLGYGIKGVIWYQGESNASRAYEYGSLFPFLVEQWRKEWGQGDFPFYWAQLADHKPEKSTPGESDWAELREAQTKTLQLPNTGQAVIIDIGEGKDIHPKNKADVAARLVRWALAKDYGMDFPHRSPEFKSVAFNGGVARITLDYFGGSLRPFDVDEALGFAICGEDQVWHAAKGKIVAGGEIEVTSSKVASPVAVRYAWADNPECNLFSDAGLPVTPFRTDDFPMVTQPRPEPVAPEEATQPPN
ncbi:MAG: sialate O-acetylesterase [Luteolibacter sp.]